MAKYIIEFKDTREGKFIEKEVFNLLSVQSMFYQGETHFTCVEVIDGEDEVDWVYRITQTYKGCTYHYNNGVLEIYDEDDEVHKFNFKDYKVK